MLLKINKKHSSICFLICVSWKCSLILQAFHRPYHLFAYKNLKLRHLGLGNNYWVLFPRDQNLANPLPEKHLIYLCEEEQYLKPRHNCVPCISSVSSRNSFWVQNFLNHLIARFPRFNKNTGVRFLHSLPLRVEQ